MLVQKTYHHGNLKATCIQKGIEILQEEGLGKLSLRNVAKKSNVSHNAPYRYFKNKQALLVAIAEEIYAELAQVIFQILENTSNQPEKDFSNMCLAYYQYAIENPVKYRFVAGSTIDEEGNYNQLTSIVNEVYILLRNFIDFHIQKGNFRALDPDKMAIHCIATMHGFCLILVENKLNLLKAQPRDYLQKLEFIIGQLLYTLSKNKA